MTAPFRTPDATFLLAEDPDGINRAADELARADAARLTSAELAADVRDNWSHGDGEEVARPAQGLVLLVCGRM